jgi:hypothetical protein
MGENIMRSQQLSLGLYDTDKIISNYLRWYDPVLEPWADKKITLLELGVDKGGSLLLWRDYFPLGTIVGIDIKQPKDFTPGERIYVFEGSQTNLHFLSEVAKKMAPEGFDIIIDDASHIGELTKKAFWYLFDNHLKSGGLYVIEDWGTGYWDNWPDGKKVKSKRPLQKVLSRLNLAAKGHLKIPFRSHSYGMVGFIKELVDEQGAADMTKRCGDDEPKRQSKFESMLITPSIVFVKKALK